MQDNVLKELKELKAGVGTALQTLNSRVGELERSLKEALMSQHAHRAACSVETSRISEDAKTHINKFQNSVAEYKKKIDQESKFLSGQYAYLSTNIPSSEQFTKAISSFEQRIKMTEAAYEALKKEISASIYRISLEMQVKFDEFKKEILSRPNEIPQLKKELNDKIDLVALDGTNSILRTTNCEKQLHLIEKKIEQLYLLIKKIDLHNQAS